MNKSGHDASAGRQRVALVADPGLPTDIAQELAKSLPHLLSRKARRRTDWEIQTFTAPLLADEQVGVADMVDLVLPHLTDHEWDIGVFLTDQPRRAGFDPVSAEINTDRRVALVSLPALGSLRLRSRAREAVAEAVVRIAAPKIQRDYSAVIGRRIEIHRPTAPRPTPPERLTHRYVVPGLRGHLHLVSGMVRDNRPWQLFTTLSRALAGVFATAAFGVINSSAWLVATGLDVWRQALIAFLCVLAMTVWIIIDHELWERHGSDFSRAMARLYNLVTVISISLGVLFLYLNLFAILVVVTHLLLVSSVLQQMLRTPLNAGDYLSLSWFVASFAMVGGAFGSGLEDDGTVRNAAYGVRQRKRREQQQAEREREEETQPVGDEG